MKIRAYITHKIKEGFMDCQDRFSVNSDTKSIAVSDGMSQSWQQKIWAQILVSKYTNSKDWTPSKDSVKLLCPQWREDVVALIQQLKETGVQENIIYRNERNLAEGKSAGATFVGIRFAGEEWKGSVLGDSCLIGWDGKETTIYTSQEVDSFDSHPDYFDSNPLHEGKGVPKEISGTLSKNCCLFLVSDPFSDFLFEHKKQGDVSEYIHQLLALSSHESFEKLVNEWRKKNMHNDDTTLVIIENDGTEEFSMSNIDDLESYIREEKQKADSLTPSNPTIVQVKEDQKQEESYSNLPTAISIVEEEEFLEEFLKEYKKALTQKHPHIGEYKFKWTKKAIIEAVRVVYEKYSIFNK